MRRFLMMATVLLLLMGITGVVLAADGDKPAAGPRRPGQNMQGMQKAFDGLNLTADQKAKMEQIRKEFADGMKQIQESGLSREETREKINAISKGMREKINAILTPEQREKMAAAMKEMQGRMRPGAGNMAAVTSRLKEKLGLSDKQVKQLEQIGKESNDKIEALRKGAGDDREAARDKINAVRQETAKQIMAVLTPEQREKLTAALKEMQEQKRPGAGNGPTDKPNSTKGTGPSKK
ncbi:MAG: Spy/CpxP family protein refolding chaperone [bacterium]|nr:Spy/CpxP family protein refolding chaperone [bacterium]